MVRKFTPGVLGGCLLGLHTAAMALGLGDIQLDSKLNEPLRAHIPLLSVGNLSKEQILARLAKADEFQKAGLEYYTYMNWIRLTPVVKENGEAYIELTTREPVKEPVVDLLIEVNWPNGRMQREYALLLDPPVFQEASEASKTVITQPASVSSDAAAPIGSERLVHTADGTYGPVKQNDTLWSIAKRVRPNRSVTVHQTMVALYYANPEAFADNNMNNLQAGRVLKLPDDQSIKAISQQEALLEIARQNQAWSGHSRPAARPFGSVDTADYAPPSQEGKDVARLRLTAPGEQDGAGSPAGSSEEMVATLQAENQMLRSQVEETNERLSKLERLLELKDAELARLQEQGSGQAIDSESIEQDVGQTGDMALEGDNSDLGQQQSLEATGDDLQQAMKDEEETSDAGLAPSEGVDVLEAEQSERAVDESKAETADEPSADESSLSATESEKQPAKQLANAQSQQAEKGLIDRLLDMGLAFWSAVVSGIGLLVFGVVWFRKRRMASEAYQNSLDVPLETAEDDDSIPELADELLNPTMESDDFIPESEVEALEQAAEEEESDPLGEADVYIAYGKFEQAKSLLERAIEAQPDRVDLRLKLMECLAEMKAVDEFNEQKAALEPLMATDEVVAEKVSEIERAAWPEEFGEEPEVEMPSVEDIFGELAFAEQENTAPGGAEDDADAASRHADEASQETGSDNNGGDIDDALAMDGSDDLAEGLDFDLALEEGDADASQQSEEWLPAQEDVMDITDGDIDEAPEAIDDELDMDDSLMLDEGLSEEDESMELDDEQLDLGDADEIATKLDLARAYIDMEDFDSAREILTEVLEEGNDEQKAEAKDLMAQI